jgi:hypothetical protein
MNKIVEDQDAKLRSRKCRNVNQHRQAAEGSLGRLASELAHLWAARRPVADTPRGHTRFLMQPAALACCRLLAAALSATGSRPGRDESRDDSSPHAISRPGLAEFVSARSRLPEDAVAGSNMAGGGVRPAIHPRGSAQAPACWLRPTRPT